MSQAAVDQQSLKAALVGVIGEAHVSEDFERREFMSQDVWCKDTVADLVVAPADSNSLAACVGLATQAGFAVVARGGGMSYTKGYVPQRSASVLFDLSRMNQVVAINRDDMVVTVQSGCTWKTLYEALKGTGLRTPYWGTLSGLKATVAGSISQNSIFWGSSQYGSSVDSVVSMDIALADGSILSTGSAAQKNSTAFFRHFGPDLTGLFCCDAGALGIKASVTLRLIAERPAKAYLSFDVPEYPALLALMGDIARGDLSSECFGFDPGLSQMRAQRDSLVSDVKALGEVVKQSGSVLNAVKNAAKISLAGRRFMNDLRYPLHVIIEERNEAAADAVVDEIRQLAKRHGASEIENSIPKILRANPFPPVNNVLGPQGQRWVPVHGLVSHSKAEQVVDGIEAIFARHQADIEQFDINTGYLFATVSSNCVAIEPVFFWPDQAEALHVQTVEASYYEKLPKLESNPQALQLVQTMRQEMVDLFSELGSSHLQLGKVYHYLDALDPTAQRLITEIKSSLDPKGLMNPGCLGFV